MHLRDYQTRAVDWCLARFAKGVLRVLLISPTGSGKTITATEVMRRVAALGGRVLFVVHRREIVEQTANTIRNLGLPCGVIMAHVEPRAHEPIQVASIQTLAARKNVDLDTALLIVDEAHHYVDDSLYGRVRNLIPHANILGLTATPWRMGGQGTAELWDEHLVVTTPRELRDVGHLAPVTGHLFEEISAEGVATRGGDYVQSELAATQLGSRVLGDVVTEWRNRAGGARTILFACGVEHSKKFVAEFRAAGVAAEHVDGSIPRAERAAVWARLKQGVTRVVSNCAVATEGFDLPELECVILARPTKSEALYLQMVGRVLRVAPGKTLARIHDHAGNIRRHGLPYDERDWSPTKRKPKADALPPQCKECGAYFSDTDVACPECGAPRSTEQGPRAGPTHVTESQAISIEQYQDDRNRRNGPVAFSRPGEILVGTLIGREKAEGQWGPVERFHFEGCKGSRFWVDAPSDLRSKLAKVPYGTDVRMRYTHAERVGDRTKRMFEVHTRRKSEESAA